MDGFNHIHVVAEYTLYVGTLVKCDFKICMYKFIPWLALLITYYRFCLRGLSFLGVYVSMCSTSWHSSKTRLLLWHCLASQVARSELYWSLRRNRQCRCHCGTIPSECRSKSASHHPPFLDSIPYINMILHSPSYNNVLLYSTGVMLIYSRDLWYTPRHMWNHHCSMCVQIW